MIQGGSGSAKSKLFAQQSNPVRSSKGGYLRCPFAINSNFAELAARHVQASTSNKSNANAYFDKYAKEVRTGEGDTYLSSNLRKNWSYASNGDESDEENSNDVDRPWTRAGVGARTLNARDKRAQQEQAELVYGNGQSSRNVSKEIDNNNKNNNVNNSTTSQSASTTEQEHKPQKVEAELHASSTSEHNVKGKEIFATDIKDQVTLQRVLPRKMRQKMHSNEESIPEKSTYNSYKDDEDEISKTETVTNKLCKATSINTAKDCSASVEEHQIARKKNKKKNRKQSRSSETSTYEDVLSRGKSQSTEADTHNVELGEVARRTNINNLKCDNEQHDQETSQRTQSTHQHLKVNILPTLNRVQQLDALRQQALFGNKRRRQ